MGHDARIRVNAAQTARGLWQINVTVEYDGPYIKVSEDHDDEGNIQWLTHSEVVIRKIKEMERELRSAGKRLVGDNVPD